MATDVNISRSDVEAAVDAVAVGEFGHRTMVALVPEGISPGKIFEVHDATAQTSNHLSAGPTLCEERDFLEANKKCVTQSDLRSAACRLPAGAGVGTVAEMVFEGVEYVIRLASGAGAA